MGALPPPIVEPPAGMPAFSVPPALLPPVSPAFLFSSPLVIPALPGVPGSEMVWMVATMSGRFWMNSDDEN